MSAKEGLISASGFAVQAKREAGHDAHWHQHDCAMILWPQLGHLETSWAASEDPQALHTARCSRRLALVLPAGTPHRTVATGGKQRHGELYVAPDFLQSPQVGGALALDAASSAMFEALLTTSLSARGADLLVRALLDQLSACRPWQAEPPTARLSDRMVARYASALERAEPMPQIDRVAAELGLSARQLERVCMRELGATPVQVRRRLLAADARRQLLAGTPLASVSAALGFASSGHLTRLLRSQQ